MNKPIRKAVRTYLIEGNSIVAIKHKEKESRNFYDIPGGKIEENEYKGKPEEFEENSSEWINIEELLTKSKIFPSIEVIKFLNQDNNINLKIDIDNNHKIIKIEKINFI